MNPAIRSRHEAAHRLAALVAWRWGTIAAAALAGALALDGLLDPAAGAVGAAVAAVLCSGAQVARQVLLADWSLRDDLADIPDVARARERLVCAKRRRDTVRSLRAIAGQRSVSRHDVAPLVVKRIGPVRADLLAMAEELERAPALEPRTMAEITVLITDGARSPLLNEAVPESELAILLRRIRFRLAVPPGDHLRPVS